MINRNDLAGMQFEHLHVIQRVDDYVTSGGNRLVAYECECDCKKHVIVLGQKLRAGRAKSCGTCGIYKDYSDIIGKTFNHLKVLRRVEDHISSGGNKFPAYECQCECGNLVVVTAGHLKTNHTTSCGKCGIYDRKHDLTGKTFDKLTVISENGYYEYPNGERDYKWLCKCKCGNYITIRGNSLKADGNHNCGCYRNDIRVTDDDMVDKSFGLLTVLERDEPIYSNTGILISMWKCQCECGNVAIVRGSSLRNGKTKSCGCGINSLSEKIARQYFDSQNIWYDMYCRFSDLRGVGGNLLSYDFAIRVNGHFALIELQGGQHYKPVKYFGGEEKFKKQQMHDELKKNYAADYNIPLCCIDCSGLFTDTYIVENIAKFISEICVVP